MGKAEGGTMTVLDRRIGWYVRAVAWGGVGVMIAWILVWSFRAMEVGFMLEDLRSCRYGPMAGCDARLRLYGVVPACWYDCQRDGEMAWPDCIVACRGN